MASNDCSCTVTSTTVGGTLTGGIQDIAALLPLLGTEQCEDHVSSALTRGYLYAAASPMSLFGSLGLARAGLKTLLASVSIPSWNFAGARTLANMGFQPQGMNLSLIMIDPNDKEQRYLVESRLEKLVEELHIDKAKIQGVRHKTIRWNLMMTFLSAILCSFGVLPYIFLTVKIGTSLPHQTRWTFPALRVVGGFLTTTTIQFIIQRRVTTLARRWISEYCSNENAAEESGISAHDDTKDVEKSPKVVVTDSNSPVTWFLLILLLLGVLASIAGYVGCFSVVQSANRSTGPLSWLCLEAGLSLLRMFLWGYNPLFDDAPPLKLILARDPHPPLPTCKLYDHDIETEKILPLTRANQFLNSITSFTGVVERFDHPDVTLYYTLTWSAVPHAGSSNVTLHEPGEHVLYITIFDHKERVNTRVYTQRGGADFFYTTESSLPNIDPKQGLLEITLGEEVDNKDDPITGDRDLRSKLNTHYRSIMDQIYLAIGQPEWDPTYTIENKWTLALVHTTSTRQSRKGDLSDNNAALPTLSLRDFWYLQHGRLEKICQSLCLARGMWIATYMEWGTRQMRERFKLQASTMIDDDVHEVPTSRTKATGKRRMLFDKTETLESAQASFDREDIESQVIDLIRHMELLLVQEMDIWEQHLWDQANKFIRRVYGLEARLTKEWKWSFRTRLDAAIRGMDARFDTAEHDSENDDLTRKWQCAHDDIRKAWDALAEKPTPSPPPTNLSCLERLQTEYQKSARDIEAVIGWSQLTAAERERLLQQSEITSRSTIELNEATFWMDDPSGLIEYRLSRSKWVDLDIQRVITRYLRALVTANGIIFIRFRNVSSDDDYAQVANLIRNLPSVTSIYVPDSHRLPVIHRDTPLFIGHAGHSNFHDNQSKLERTRRTHLFIDAEYLPDVRPTQLALWRGSKIMVSFFGPPSGNLVFKLTHSSRIGQAILTLKDSHGSRTFEYRVPSSLTTTNITLFPGPSEYPSFVPNTRNNMIIEVTEGYWYEYFVRDMHLHDEAGNDYNPISPEA